MPFLRKKLSRNSAGLYVPASGGGSPTQVRVTFQASTSSPMILDHASIGIQAGAGNAWDTTLTPVELLFSGVSGFSILASATITSDWASLGISSSTGTVASRTMTTQGSGWGGFSIRQVISPITGGSPVVVVMDNNAIANNVAYVASDNAYYTGSATYANATPAGLSPDLNHCYGVILIETQ